MTDTLTERVLTERVARAICYAEQPLRSCDCVGECQARKIIDEDVRMDMARAAIAVMDAATDDYSLSQKLSASLTREAALRAELSAANVLAEKWEDNYYKLAKENEADEASLRAELAIEREKHERAQAEIGSLQNHLNREHLRYAAELAAAKERAECAEAERDALRADIELFENAIVEAIGGADYLDPPDGGDVPLPEQVQRMRAERDALRADLAAVRDELLRVSLAKLQPIAALVDMTPGGFPDHDLCPIRLGQARDLREIHARIDAVLKGGE